MMLSLGMSPRKPKQFQMVKPPKLKKKRPLEKKLRRNLKQRERQHILVLTNMRKYAVASKMIYLSSVVK